MEHEEGDVTAYAVDAVRRLVAVDAAHGARAAVPLVRAALRGLPDTAGRADSDRVAALAELYEVAGWILFDAGHYRRAHRLNARALALAERCGDRWTARLTLLNDSMLLAHTGRPRAALAAAARARGPRPLPPRVASLVLIREAHATALLGARSEPRALLAGARSLFLDGVSRHDPPWTWWLDEWELLGHRGWVLARLGHTDRALPALHRAATAPGPSYRHLFTAQLLAALVRAGAWRDAERLVADLAPRARGIGSARTTEVLGRIARHLRAPGTAPLALRDAAVFLLESLHATGPARRP
ncbi:DNA-binding protein [Streptomyces sp. NRRL B-1347]|uniref:DNA-binding protein n=1 Tax=Streptomyces sp. NRRL B-1347 TaxID=1476877 RepID=UPI000B32576C|nr:DNA-binding protein [Streptomyces sp. NRRL B-1347]